MSITLYKLTPPENENIADQCPELHQIWEIPYLQERALRSYLVWNLVEKTGEIFLIKNDAAIVGLTGWWQDENITDTIRLRWHGIIPSKRGKGYSDEALALLIKHLNDVLPKQYKYVSESLSTGRESAPKIKRHFERLGFVVFDDPTYGDNGFGSTISMRKNIPGR